jgi:two-component system chemotaxis response regulator CheB
MSVIKRPKFSKQVHVVLIGASAGGMDALKRLVAQLPADFAAPVFIVQHMGANVTGNILVEVLNQHGALPCAHAVSGEKVKPGRIYIAPSDHHMMLRKDEILVTKGAMENRSRPAIDPLFRSAAVAYGNRAIGVVLTGYLNDGSAGLSTIRRCGGICIVQDPQDAAYPDMPQHALNEVKVDYCVPLAEMGPLLAKLLLKKPRAAAAVPKDIQIEARIAERVLSDLPSVEALGDQVPFNCPGCGGVLWKVRQANTYRFRCHTGHAFTAEVLLAEQTAKIEETLWVALRMFEERKNLLTTMVSQSEGKPNALTRSTEERAQESQVHIDRIRAMLLSSDKATEDDLQAIRPAKRKKRS